MCPSSCQYPAERPTCRPENRAWPGTQDSFSFQSLGSSLWPEAALRASVTGLSWRLSCNPMQSVAAQCLSNLSVVGEGGDSGPVPQQMSPASSIRDELPPCGPAWPPLPTHLGANLLERLSPLAQCTELQTAQPTSCYLQSKAVHSPRWVFVFKPPDDAWAQLLLTMFFFFFFF